MRMTETIIVVFAIAIAIAFTSTINRYVVRVENPYYAAAQ